MNSHIARALLDDAFYQVLDNKVFRLLVLLALALVAPTFLIGFHEQEVSILFGLKSITYQQLFSVVGRRLPDTKDIHIEVVQSLQSIVIDGLAGTIGITFCIAATAFFVPRMLEKGAADTLFSKPVSRLALVFARYFSGLIFVSALAVLLVVGMHVGLLINSGYSDPGFLWGALTLIYTFALIHSFSTCAAAFTRNSVATILTTLMLFMLNGCIHSIWIFSQHQAEGERLRHDADESPIASSNGGFFLDLFRDTFNAAHYALPKTNDADILTRKLRLAVTRSAPILTDATGNLVVARNPEGFELASGGGDSADLSRKHAVWIAKDERGRIELSRRTRIIERAPDKESQRAPPKSGVRKLFASMAAEEYLKSIADRPEVTKKPTRSRSQLGSLGADEVDWTESRDGGTLVRKHLVSTAGDWLFELDVSIDSDEYSANRGSESLTEFLSGFSLLEGDANTLRPNEWYERQLGWSAPLKYNIFFSIASSLAFCAAMLALAWWKVSRIDF
jgi:ABC-type transport system involved in multi-copper enzyme maturation permease subunit